jgi:hypothetical protein
MKSESQAYSRRPGHRWEDNTEMYINKTCFYNAELFQIAFSAVE